MPPTTFLPFFKMAPNAPTRRSTFLSNTKSTPLTSTLLEPAPPISLTPRRPHDNDNTNNSIDAAPIFDTNSANNSNGNSSNATNNTRINIASAASSSSSSSHGNTIHINAETFDSDSTDISPTISVSTTARKNEPKPECARTPPPKVSTQAPPQDKPGE